MTKEETFHSVNRLPPSAPCLCQSKESVRDVSEHLSTMYQGRTSRPRMTKGREARVTKGGARVTKGRAEGDEASRTGRG